jgi:hypothetical protein
MREWKARRGLWLRNLGEVKRELAHERFPRSANEGLSATAALSEIALSLRGGGRRRLRRRRGTPRA